MQPYRPHLIRANRNTVHIFFATCPRGLELILTSELEHLGANDLVAAQGGLTFTGNFRLCYRVNLESRIASRVLWRGRHRDYRGGEDIYLAGRWFPLAGWVFSPPTIKKKRSAAQSPPNGIEFFTLC